MPSLEPQFDSYRGLRAGDYVIGAVCTSVTEDYAVIRSTFLFEAENFQLLANGGWELLHPPVYVPADLAPGGYTLLLRLIMSKRNVIWTVVIAVALVIFGLRVNSANATPMQYFGTPVFYGKYTPDQTNCYYNPLVRYGFCGNAKDPEEGEVGFTDPTNPTKGVGYVIRLFTEVVCVNGRCNSNYGEPLGRIADTTTSYWYIPTGYYLANSGSATVAFKHGTGPLAYEFPIRNVMVLPTLQDPPNGVIEHKPNDGFDRYDVYCNKALECSYMGRVMLLSQLNDYIPKVLTFNCDQYFCYNSDLTIAGLNPKGV